MDILRVIAVGTDRHVATARDDCQGGYPTSNIVASSIAPMSSYSSGIMTYPFVIFRLRHRPNFFSSASPRYVPCYLANTLRWCVGLLRPYALLSTLARCHVDCSLSCCSLKQAPTTLLGRLWPGHNYNSIAVLLITLTCLLCTTRVFQSSLARAIHASCGVGWTPLHARHQSSLPSRLSLQFETLSQHVRLTP